MAAGGLVRRLLGTSVATGAGFAWGHAAGPIVAAPLRLLGQEANEKWPFEQLNPQTAANAEVVGAYTAAQMRAEAARSGVNTARANVLRALAGQAPGFAQLAALRNRNRITDAEFEKGLAQLGIRDEWRDDVRALRFSFPSGPELAQMAVQGVLDVDDARAAAALVGTDATTFDRYYRVSGDPPGGQQLLELWNRREINEADVDRGLKQSRLKPEWVDHFKALRRYLIPPSDVIRLAVHEVYDPAKRKALNLDAEFPQAFADKAALLGISEQDARDLWAGHWGLPSYTQGAQMMFRGEISADQYDGLLAALDYAPTWRKKLAAIARAIPSVSDFIRFAVHEVFDPQQRRQLDLDADYPEAFTAKAALHGLSEQDARDYWAAHWRLPSATQGYRMLWRDEIDENGLDGLLKALDYAPTWRQKLANIARPTLGRIDLRRAYAAGLINADQAHAGYRKLGYTDPDATLLVRLATATTSTSARDLTVAQLTSEYQGAFIDRDQYVTAIEQLGFSEAEAQQLADLGDAKRAARSRDQFVNRIHTQYVGHKITLEAATAALEQGNINARARAIMLDEWQHERTVNVARLTAAQVRSLYKKSEIDEATALAELEERGYAADEASLFLRA